MVTEEQYIANLLLRSFENGLSESERLQLDEWLSQDEAHLTLYKEMLADDRSLFATLHQLKADKQTDIAQELYQKIMAATGLDMPRPIYIMRKWRWAAASIFLALVVGLFYLVVNKNTSLPDDAVATATEITSGRDGAILTLADGSQVILDSLKNGVVASQNGSSLILKDGQLTYDPSGKTASTVAYNIMSTPKGRKFRLTLPDRTQVWLNAASSIRYPTIFTGKERRVEINGEAYLEVAQNKNMPFHVIANNKTAIEVLGTHFNVNAYDNEKVSRTTLLEGRIKVNNTVIMPGQQAEVDMNTGTGIGVIGHADIEKVMAWKNDLFNFEGVSLGDAMRQLERWYDIEVTYEKNIPEKKLMGKMTKDISLPDLLIILRELGVHSKLEGRRLIVLSAEDR
jgi:transmembrane sensor